ncbi:MAG: ATP-binding protein [Candidatus Magnetominusculus sp. LBB02]|nr:ATP-binding protein [Candidatus Magnetominusculus sp. LBB02]
MEETYSFYEDEEQEPKATDASWKVLIVDDDIEVHRATRSSIADFVFQGKGLELLFATSAMEARKLISAHDDIAVILLDVVMEDDLAGLNFAKYVREELKNRFVRILLRTGQPGIAPEKSVIVDYDINGFLEKSDLTIQKLYTAIITCLRSYRDIIDLDNANAALKTEFEMRIEAERKMAEQAQQAAIGLAIAQIIHGAKNILNALKGGKYIIEAALKDENLELIKKGWDVTKIGISRMEDLTAGLLDLSRYNQLKPEPHSLNAVVAEVLETCRNTQSCSTMNDVAIIADIEEALPLARFDYKAIHTVLMNLLSNSVDACKDKADGASGRVKMRTYLCGDDYVNLDVEDNGCGIKPEDLENIFKLFYTTKHSKGNGLGLSITKKIIEEHGGKLSVSSELGVGTKFTISLPKDRRHK